MTTMISECRWELVSAYVVVCEGWWVSVGVSGSRWVCRWVSVGVSGLQWVSVGVMGVSGLQWVSVGVSGCWWVSVGVGRCVGGCHWLFLEVGDENFG